MEDLSNLCNGHFYRFIVLLCITCVRSYAAPLSSPKKRLTSRLCPECGEEMQAIFLNWFTKRYIEKTDIKRDMVLKSPSSYFDTGFIHCCAMTAMGFYHSEWNTEGPSIVDTVPGENDIYMANLPNQILNFRMKDVTNEHAERRELFKEIIKHQKKLKVLNSDILLKDARFGKAATIAKDIGFTEDLLSCFGADDTPPHCASPLGSAWRNVNAPQISGPPTSLANSESLHQSINVGVSIPTPTCNSLPTSSVSAVPEGLSYTALLSGQSAQTYYLDPQGQYYTVIPSAPAPPPAADSHGQYYPALPPSMPSGLPASPPATTVQPAIVSPQYSTSLPPPSAPPVQPQPTILPPPPAQTVQPAILPPPSASTVQSATLPPLSPPAPFSPPPPPLTMPSTPSASIVPPIRISRGKGDWFKEQEAKKVTLKRKLTESRNKMYDTKKSINLIEIKLNQFHKELLDLKEQYRIDKNLYHSNKIKYQDFIMTEEDDSE